MNKLSLGLVIAGVTIRIAFIGIMWAGLSLVVQFALVFAWSHWWSKRRIERLEDQVLISDNGLVTWYKRSEETPESIAYLQKYGNASNWPWYFPLPFIGDKSTLQDGRRVVVTDVTFDHTKGMSIIDVQEA